MKLCRHSSGAWIATQGEAKTYAKDNGGTWEVIDVPTDKDGLLNYLNELRHPRPDTVVIATADMNREKGGEPSIQHEVPITPPPPPAAPTQNDEDLKAKMRRALKALADDGIEERIMAARGAPLARFMLASIERFGELQGEAWPHARAMLDQHPRVNIRDRGLHLLNLALIDRLQPKTADIKAAA